MKLFIVFKLRFQNTYYLVHCLFFQVRLFNQHLARRSQHSLRRIDTDGLDCIDHPSVDFISELVEIDILVLRAFSSNSRNTSIVYSVNILASLIFKPPLPIASDTSSGRRNTSAFRSSSFRSDRRDLCRAQCTLDKQ